MPLPQMFSRIFPSRWAQRDALYGYLFVLPQVLGFLVLVLGPLVMVFVFSTQSRGLLSPKVEFVGLANYERLFTQDPLFRQVLGNTLVFAAGLVPLNVVLALVLALVHAGVIPVLTAIRALTVGPAAALGIAAGRLANGSIADLTLIDPDKRWTVDPATFRSRSRNTPFAGMAMRGKALAVCLAGRVVDGDLDGRFTR